jgi:hypothetical protein
MAAARFPHAQARVHEELEAVIGRETRMEVKLIVVQNRLTLYRSSYFRGLVAACSGSSLHSGGFSMEAYQPNR